VALLLVSFSVAFQTHFANGAFKEYATELCDDHTDANALQNASELAWLCVDPLMRCDVTLKVLRAALLSNKKPSRLAA